LVSHEFSFQKFDEFSVEVKKSSLSKFIKDQSYFFLSWEKDPTIKSMLVMLDAIHLKFKNSSGFLAKLIDQHNLLATFQFIPIKNFGLSDSLYIKMNSRGKALTEFENFKARFEQHLEVEYPERKLDFVKLIDNKWTDFFWQHKEDNVIDQPFMRFFYFITEMLYYRNLNAETQKILDYAENNPKIDFELIRLVYSDHSNIDFFFNCLGKLYLIGETKSFFDQIFTKEHHEQGKVVLFESNTDLFKRCIQGKDFTIPEKLLLFSTLQFCIKNDSHEVTEDLVDFIRVIRNLIIRVRQQKQTQFISNLRNESIPRQTAFIDTELLTGLNIYSTLNLLNTQYGFSKESVEHEKLKAKLILSNPLSKAHLHQLEDHELLRGNLSNLSIEENISELSTFYQSFKETWETGNDYKITRALLTVGDYAIYTGWSALGGKWFLGNDERWNTILTHPDSNIKSVLPSFLRIYREANGIGGADKLENIIRNWLDNAIERNWHYYFIKYSKMLSPDNNVFTFQKDTTNFRIRNLKRDTLLAYHINPYVRAVVKIIGSDKICRMDDCYGQFTEESPLRLRNNVHLLCLEVGWQVQLPDNITLSEEVSNEFDLSKNEGSDHFLLKENVNYDRIEVAVEFCKKLYAAVLID
jgi:hypothetical protein